jgi:acetate kinase
LILTINGGSSSIKFAAFAAAPTPERAFHGQVERVGTPSARLTATPDGSSEIPNAGATFET